MSPHTTLVWAVASLSVAMVNSFPHGAPTGACRDGLPQHGFDRQPLPMPYDINFSMQTPTQYEVSVVGDGMMGDGVFKGLLLTVRDRSSGSIIGSFSDFVTSKYSAACSSRGMSGVTHRNSDDVASATFVWNSAADYDLNDLELWVTIVQEQDTFWHNKIPLTDFGVENNVVTDELPGPITEEASTTFSPSTSDQPITTPTRMSMIPSTSMSELPDDNNIVTEETDSDEPSTTFTPSTSDQPITTPTRPSTTRPTTSRPTTSRPSTTRPATTQPIKTTRPVTKTIPTTTTTTQRPTTTTTRKPSSTQKLLASEITGSDVDATTSYPFFTTDFWMPVVTLKYRPRPTMKISGQTFHYFCTADRKTGHVFAIKPGTACRTYIHSVNGVAVGEQTCPAGTSFLLDGCVCSHARDLFCPGFLL